jgi:phosphonoacetaldehyde hydrolase
MDIDSFDHEKSLSEAEIQRRLAFTRETLRKAGSHYVIDTFDELPAVIEDVNARLARG